MAMGRMMHWGQSHLVLLTVAVVVVTVGIGVILFH
jgi:hypothetical protein